MEGRVFYWNRTNVPLHNQGVNESTGVPSFLIQCTDDTKGKKETSMEPSSCLSLIN